MIFALKNMLHFVSVLMNYALIVGL